MNGINALYDTSYHMRAQWEDTCIQQLCLCQTLNLQAPSSPVELWRHKDLLLSHLVWRVCLCYSSPGQTWRQTLWADMPGTTTKSWAYCPPHQFSAGHLSCSLPWDEVHPGLGLKRSKMPHAAAHVSGLTLHHPVEDVFISGHLLCVWNHHFEIIQSWFLLLLYPGTSL